MRLGMRLCVRLCMRLGMRLFKGLISMRDVDITSWVAGSECNVHI